MHKWNRGKSSIYLFWTIEHPPEDDTWSNKYKSGVGRLQIREHLSHKNRNGTDLPQGGINTLAGKDSHLCLIVCFTASSEHTISNRLNAGPLTQTGFPDGEDYFIQLENKGVEGLPGGFFFFFSFFNVVDNCSYMPHPSQGGSPCQSQLVCLSLHVPSSLVAL